MKGDEVSQVEVESFMLRDNATLSKFLQLSLFRNGYLLGTSSLPMNLVSNFMEEHLLQYKMNFC